MPSRGTLEMPQRPRLLLAGGVLLLVVAAAMSWWRSSSPEALPRSEEVVNATVKVDQPVYVEVFRAGAGFDRTLQLTGVKVHATSNTAVRITPLLCRGGGFVQTTDPAAFCEALVDPEDRTFGSGDGIVLEVVSDAPAVAVVDPVRLAFRENLHTATLPAGAGAVVRVLGS